MGLAATVDPPLIALVAGLVVVGLTAWARLVGRFLFGFWCEKLIVVGGFCGVCACLARGTGDFGRACGFVL